MKGILYGIGVGPGDPELVTVKAARLIGEADVILTPKTEKKSDSVAFTIAKPYINENTEIVHVTFPMNLSDPWGDAAEEAKNTIVELLDKGKKVVFLTLGDPMFYSTYMYVYRLVETAGYEIETIPGITAFCAIGSHIGHPIVEDEEILTVIPATASEERICKALAAADDAVIMKVYKRFDKVKRALDANGMLDEAVMISRIGLDDEVINRNLRDLPSDEPLNYLTTILTKKKK